LQDSDNNPPTPGDITDLLTAIYHADSEMLDYIFREMKVNDKFWLRNRKNIRAMTGYIERRIL
jgi:hypothetical protein